jgi:hypothetical protein
MRKITLPIPDFQNYGPELWIHIILTVVQFWESVRQNPGFAQIPDDSLLYFPSFAALLSFGNMKVS